MPTCTATYGFWENSSVVPSSSSQQLSITLSFPGTGGVTSTGFGAAKHGSEFKKKFSSPESSHAHPRCILGDAMARLSGCCGPKSGKSREILVSGTHAGSKATERPNCDISSHTEFYCSVKLLHCKWQFEAQCHIIVGHTGPACQVSVPARTPDKNQAPSIEQSLAQQ